MSLTKREIEMLGMKLKDRLSNREIAQRLHVSEAYVSKTLKNILKKIKSIEDAIKVCMEIGLMKGEKIEVSPEALKMIHKRAIELLKSGVRKDAF